MQISADFREILKSAELFRSVFTLSEYLCRFRDSSAELIQFLIVYIAYRCELFLQFLRVGVLPFAEILQGRILIPQLGVHIAQKNHGVFRNHNS